MDDRSTAPNAVDEILDTRGAAELLKVSKRTIQAWTKEGRIPAIRVCPRVTRYSRLAILQWLKEKSQPATTT